MPHERSPGRCVPLTPAPSSPIQPCGLALPSKEQPPPWVAFWTAPKSFQAAQKAKLPNFLPLPSHILYEKHVRRDVSTPSLARAGCGGCMVLVQPSFDDSLIADATAPFPAEVEFLI